MADMGMALAVLDHAATYNDVGGWHTVTDFWSAEDILAELQTLETKTGRALSLDTAASAHFTQIANPTGARTRH